MTWIGKRIARLEDSKLVKGQGRYVGDITLPGTVHAVIVRSQHAHANILSIDHEKARSYPGVIEVLTPNSNLPGPLPILLTQPGLLQPVTGYPLALDKVRYVGEPIAVIVAENRYIAEDAADLIRVQYDPLPVVNDLESSLDPNLGKVHDSLPDNIAGRYRQRIGDVDAVWHEAALVIEETFYCERGSHQPMETRGVMAEWNSWEQSLTVWIPSQAPHRHQNFLSKLLNLPLERIRVIVPDVGGSFGQKGNIYPEDILIPLLAIHLNRPVKWIEDRRENFLAGTQERIQIHKVVAAADQNGRLLAFRDHFLHDSGAYAPYGVRVPAITASVLQGPYHIPNLDIQYTSLYTNHPPVGVFRGPGRVPAAFVMERVLDRIAYRLGLSPEEIRRRNLIPQEMMPYDTRTGFLGSPQVYDSGNFPEMFRKALEISDYNGWRQHQKEAAKKGRHIGIGFGMYVERTGSGNFEGATVRVDPGGLVYVYTGAAPQGQGHKTILAQICSDYLGVNPCHVSVVPGDTEKIPYGTGSYGSRTAVVAGSAVALAAEEVRRRAYAMAADHFEVDQDDLTMVDGVFQVLGMHDQKISLWNLADKAHSSRIPLDDGNSSPGLQATRYFYPHSAGTFASGVHVAVVEVDPSDATVRVLAYFIVDDCGVQINPTLVEGQICGGVAQGIGASLYERLIYDENGQLLTATYMDYLLPTANEVPTISLGHHTTPSSTNPLGAKGSGEGGVIPVAAAISGAVEDAFSGRIAVTRFPLTTQVLWNLLKPQTEIEVTRLKTDPRM